jgi:catechol 2,3-dioxygenase-like lactoylglutathione lyase family enzyme
MVSGFDRIIISVTDLQVAAADYGRLLGVTPLACTTAQGLAALWIGLPNVAILLVQAEVAEARISGLVFCDPAASRPTPVANSRGLDLALDDGASGRAYRNAHPQALSAGLSVDHLVLYTANADDCIDLFSHQLGIRLALDKTVPAWGGRMLFLRTGKLTLEIIEPQPEKVAQDYFWGIAYQCADIEQAAADLGGRGVELSAIRAGRKPGTRVATLRSDCLGIPSLLVEPV